ncbi:MAG: hypothetical protein HYT12_01970 [Candidatus Liptonbacteria bacterium]|nr:hypothetical protein [Candidatus Liptonbacteria bacterium]
MINSQNIKPFFIFSAITIIAVSFLIAGFNVYPPPSGNSSLFVPPAINLAAGNGLIDDLSHIRLNQTKDARFISYPPLYPVLLSILMPRTDSIGAFVAIAVMEILIISFTALILYKILRTTGDNGEISWFNILIIIFSIFAIAGPLLNYNGTRPEIVFQLISVAWIMSVIYLTRHKNLWMLLGIIIGAGLATHPLHGFYFSILSALLFSYVTNTKSAINNILRAGVLGVLVFLLILALSPHGALDYLNGMRDMAFRYASTMIFWTGSSPLTGFESPLNTYGQDLLRYLVLSPASFFWGPFVLFVLILAAKNYKRLNSGIKSPHLFYLFLFVFLAVMSGIIFLGHADSIYYLTMLGSIFVVIASYLVSKEKVFGRVVLFMLLATMSISSLRVFVLMPFYFLDGVRISEARNIIENLNLPDCDDCVGISPANLWVLSENYPSIITELQAERTGENLGKTAKIILLGQHGSSLMEPPKEIKGCQIEKDYFAKEKPPSFFGIKIANIIPGHGFAVYECEIQTKSI